MNDINTSVRDFHARKLLMIKEAWEYFITNPYQLAYHTAFDNFSKTLNKQANSDKMKIELALTALCLCGGSLLTAVFAGVAIKAVAGKAMVDFICRYNMNRLFKLAHLVDTNKSAAFIVGAVWDQAADILTAKTKKLFEENTANFPCVNNIIQKPYEIEFALRNFVGLSLLKIGAVCQDILDSKKATADKKAAFIELVQSPFCNPPSSKVLPDNLADRIELTFYLKIILNSDWLVTHHGSPWALVDKKPIPEVPGKGYPKGSRENRIGSLMPPEITTVQYDRIGQDIIDRMNQLYKEFTKEKRPLIDSNRFGEIPSQEILKKADEILKKIGNQNLALIFGEKNLST